MPAHTGAHRQWCKAGERRAARDEQVALKLAQPREARHVTCVKRGSVACSSHPSRHVTANSRLTHPCMAGWRNSFSSKGTDRMVFVVAAPGLNPHAIPWPPAH